MNNPIAQWCGIVVAIVIAAIGAFAHVSAPQGEQQVGGTTQGFENAALGFRVNGTEIVNAVRQASFTGATTTGTGTTSVKIISSGSTTGGCIQIDSSTSTPMKIEATTTGPTQLQWGTCL